MTTTNLADTAEKNIRDILALAILHTKEHDAVIVFDSDCALAVTLTEAYKRCLPHAHYIPFNSTSPDTIIKQFEQLKPNDLVVLIQTTNFRLNAFRIRVELFARSLKVIEHLHLGRMQDNEPDIYVESLAYDPTYYRTIGWSLKNKIDRVQKGIVDSGGEQLLFNSPFELAKLNIGDYSQMKNVGGLFPIGEVFTEAKDLEAVNGRVRIFAFGDTTFTVNVPDKPITLIIEKGRVIDTIDSTPEFDIVLENIRADEDVVWVRELGFGLNKAFSPTRRVKDIGTYERMCGIHLSLGAKHSLYKKPQISTSAARHHVDVFAVTESVYLDDENVFINNAWQV